MDLDELIGNIQTARDTAKADAAKYRQMAEEERAKGGADGAAAAVGRRSVATTLEIVEATLNRILGEQPAAAAATD